jgi:WD40 repeat protein
VRKQARKLTSPNALVVAFWNEFNPNSQFSELPQIRNGALELVREIRNAFGDSPLQVRVLENETRQTTLTAVGELESAPHQTIVLYVASHGMVKQNALLLATKEMASSREHYNGVSVSDLLEILSRAVANVRIAFIDCCFSGAALGQMSTNDAPPMADKLAEEVPGLVIVASSSRTQVSYAIPEDEYPVFTGALISALKLLTATGRSYSVQDLFLQIKNLMSARSNKLGFEIPVPRLAASETQGETHVFGNPLVHDTGVVVARPDILQTLSAMIQGADPIVALHGHGGFGKTTLARQLRREPGVIGYFQDGIFELVLGQSVDTSSILRKLNDLLSELGAGDHAYQDLTLAGRQLSRIAEDKKILLIVDDVWRRSDLEPFIELGPLCRLLVTTRDSEALPSCRTVYVGPMTSQQSRTVLSYQLAVQGNELSTLTKICGGWPVLLRLVNGRLRDDVASGLEIEASAARIAAAYEKYGPYYFDHQKVDYRDGVLSTLLRDSISVLPPDLARFYRTLGIFPDDVKIPADLLASFWNLSIHQVGEVLRRFERAALIERVQFDAADAMEISLHDSVRDSLRNDPAAKLKETNELFLDAVRPRTSTSNYAPWVALSENADYLWRHVIWHLRAADRREELEDAFGSMEFVATHSLRAGRKATEIEALLTATFGVKNARPVHSFLVESGHLLDPLTECSFRQATLSNHLRVNDWPKKSHLRSDHTYKVADRQPSETGHVGNATACRFSPDSKLLATAGADSSVVIYDIGGTPRELGRLVGHRGWCRDVCFSPSGNRIATSADDGLIRIWSSESYICELELSGHGASVRSVCFNQKDQIISASEDGTVRVWSPTGESLAVMAQHRSGVRKCIVMSGSEKIVSCSRDGLVHVYDGTSFELLKRFTSKSESAFTLCQLNELNVCVGGADGVLRIFDIESMEILSEHQIHKRPIRDCALLSPARIVTTAGDAGPAVVTDLLTGEGYQLIGESKSWVLGCAVAKDGTRIATCSVDGTATIFASNTPESPMHIRGRSHLFWSVARGTGSDFIFGSVDGKITTTNFSSVPKELLTEHGCIRGLATSATLCVAATDEGVLVSIVSENFVYRKAHQGPARACAIDDNATRVISVGHDGFLRVTGLGELGLESRLGDLKAHDAPIHDCEVVTLKDGRCLALTASVDETVSICDIDNLLVITRSSPLGSPVNCCAAATDSDQIVVFVGLEDGRVLAARVPTDFVTNAFELHFDELGRHADWVTSLAFDPRANLLCTVSDDRTVRLWNPWPSGCVAAVSVSDPQFSCVFDETGTFLVSVGAGGAHKLQIVKQEEVLKE